MASDLVVPQDELMAQVLKYSKELSYVFVVLAIAIVLFFVYKGLKKKKPVSAD